MSCLINVLNNHIPQLAIKHNTLLFFFFSLSRAQLQASLSMEEFELPLSDSCGLSTSSCHIWNPNQWNIRINFFFRLSCLFFLESLWELKSEINFVFYGFYLSDVHAPNLLVLVSERKKQKAKREEKRRRRDKQWHVLPFSLQIGEG